MTKIVFLQRDNLFGLKSVAVLCSALLSLTSCGGNDSNVIVNTGSDGPISSEAPVVHQTGDTASGKQGFRFETFGIKGFWTDAVRLQQGMMATGMTPGKALCSTTRQLPSS